MRQIVQAFRMERVLPTVHFVLAATLLQWGYLHPHPKWWKGVDSIWVPTARLVCLGISAPAHRLSWILDGILFGSRAIPKVFGFYSEDLLFLVGVSVLWFLIGKEIDSQRFPSEHPQTKLRTGKILRNILVALYGLDLLVVICLHNVVFTNPRNGTGGDGNFTGDLIFQLLWFIWAIVLIVVPSWKLFKAARRKPMSESPASA